MLTAQKLTIQEFLDNYPDNGRYELVNGEMVRILPTRHHEDIADFIIRILDKEVEKWQLNYRVSGRISIIADRNVRQPDVSVIDRGVWESNRSAHHPILSVPLQIAIEVVSTNWEDDYIDKLAEYQQLGIKEYWIIDYLAIASRSYLGNPKQPSIFVHTLNTDRIYQKQQFCNNEPIISPTFPALELTINQILEV